MTQPLPLLPACPLPGLRRPKGSSSTPATATISMSPASSSCAPRCPPRRLGWHLRVPDRAPGHGMESAGAPRRRAGDLDVDDRIGTTSFTLSAEMRRAGEADVLVTSRRFMCTSTTRPLPSARSSRTCAPHWKPARRQAVDHAGYLRDVIAGIPQLSGTRDVDADSARALAADVIFSAHVHRHHLRHRRGRRHAKAAASRSAAAMRRRASRSAPRSPARAPA